MLHRNNIHFLLSCMNLIYNNITIHNQFTVTAVCISASFSLRAAVWIFFQTENTCLQTVRLLFCIFRNLFINITGKYCLNPAEHAETS